MSQNNAFVQNEGGFVFWTPPDAAQNKNEGVVGGSVVGTSQVFTYQAYPQFPVMQDGRIYVQAPPGMMNGAPVNTIIIPQNQTQGMQFYQDYAVAHQTHGFVFGTFCLCCITTVLIIIGYLVF